MTDDQSYSLIACIGTGFSGIGVGAQLKRWYNETDIVFFERHETSGGTWWINTYPGSGCDVPAPLYSFSFEQSPGWSSLFPPGQETRQYLDRVAEKYDLPKKMRFSSDVKSCMWDAGRNLWVLLVEDLRTSLKYYHTSKLVFSCSGQLVRPNKLDIPGTEDFNGPIFHSARWRKDVDCTGKNVVVIGNGCTAAQIVPNLLKYTPPASLIQIVRSKHWILPAPQVPYTPLLRAALTYIPGAMWLLRFIIFLLAEASFPFFYTNKLAAWYRKVATKQAENYMRRECPAELHDAVIPTFELGCKRRIFDLGYLQSLHDPHVHLETRRAKRVVADGIELEDGTKLDADVIVLANGFHTNYFLDELNVTGLNGATIADHWTHFGGPEAYNCSAISGFPNFFMILGPNAATGHTSAIMACENSINYALRVLRPILTGSKKTIQVKEDAELMYVDKMQTALRDRVWHSGCQSWYVNENNWNAMSYPWSQLHYWFRSFSPVWDDWLFG